MCAQEVDGVGDFLVQLAELTRFKEGIVPRRIAFVFVAFGKHEIASHSVELRVLVHAPVIDEHAGHRGVAEARAEHHRFRQIGIGQIATAEIGFAQIGMVKVASDKRQSSERQTAQIEVGKIPVIDRTFGQQRADRLAFQRCGISPGQMQVLGVGEAWLLEFGTGKSRSG